MPTLEPLKIVADASAQLVTWGLALLGGTVAVVVSTLYNRPMSRRGRMIYALFLPGWAFLGASIYHGDVISDRYIAGVVGPADQRLAVASAINDDFILQRNLLIAGLVTFMIWLVCFLVW